MFYALQIIPLMKAYGRGRKLELETLKMEDP